MKALLLAAGQGERLRPLTEFFPKCLAPINGIPLLAYWLKQVESAGIEEVVVNTHYLANQVQDFLQFSNLAVTHSYEKKLLGTGGTLKNCSKYLRDDDAWVVHADNLSSFNAHAFSQCHLGRRAGCELTMMTFNTDAPSECGILSVDSSGIVQKMYEKQASPDPNLGTLANAAVYIFSRSLLRELEGRDFSDISTEVLPELMRNIQSFHNSDYHRDIGRPQAFLRAQIEFTGSRALLGDFAKYRGWEKKVFADADGWRTSVAAALASSLGFTFVTQALAGSSSGDSTVVYLESLDKLPMLGDLSKWQRGAVCFGAVPVGFSAREFFAEHQIRCVALTLQ